MNPDPMHTPQLNVRQKALLFGIRGPLRIALAIAGFFGIRGPLRIALAIAGLAFAVMPCLAQQMDPVRGPLELHAPGPFFEASKGGGTYGYSIKSNFGRVKSWTYSDGETLKGKCDWVTASSADASTDASGPAAPDSNSSSNSPQQNLAAAWDLVGGPGYYAAHVQGNKILHGTFTGDKGTVLQVESLDNFVAVGVDNRGNLYKIVW
ncbi:MAG: hypothetical protein ABSF75_15970 [Terracidiphilus sp.]